MDDKYIELAKAEAQLIGFNHASQGYGIESLAERMVLTREEWIQLRVDVDLKTEDKKALDEKYGIIK